MSKKIYVGRISSATTDLALAKHFSQAGKVVSAKLIQGINPQVHAGYGYVIMGSDKETSDAIKKLNNSQLDNQRLIVKEAHYLDQERKPDYNYRYRRYR